MSVEIPPHNLAAEAAVLSAVILDSSGAKLDEVRAMVTPGQFFSRANSLVFEAVCALHDQGEKVDVVTVLQRLRDQKRAQQVGGSPYLMRILDATPAVDNVAEHARIVREHYRVRRAIALSQKRTAEGYTAVPKDPESVQKWLEEYELEVSELAHVHEQRTLVPLSNVLDETQSMLDAIRQGGTAAGVPTGFTAVDSQMTGLHDGDFYVVAARPGMGKSSYGLGVAERVAARGYAVPFFSLEMPRVQLGMRLLAMDARVNLKTMREGKLGHAEEKKLGLSIKALKAYPLYIDDSAVLTPLEIKARVKRLQREIASGKHPEVTAGRVGAVIIDYLQLVRPSRETHSREQDVASIGRDFKQLAKLLGVPVIALCQLNREVEKRTDKKPMLSDLRECLAGDSLVYNPETGTRSRIDQLAPGSAVLTLNTRTLRLEVSRCSKVVKTGKRKVVRITTASGRRLRLTADHAVFTIRGWRPIGELAKGEAFATPRSYPRRQRGAQAITVARARLLGYLVSNGSYKKNRSVSVTMPEASVRADASRIARGFSGIVPRLHRHWSGTHSVEFTVPGGAGPGGNAIINWLTDLGIRGQSTSVKTTPEAIFSSSQLAIANYLAGLFTGDGSVVRRQAGGWIVKYTSTSMTLLREVQHLLLRLGVLSQIGSPERNTKSTTDIATLRISERAAIARFAAAVPVRGKKGARLARARAWCLRGKENAQRDRLPLAVGEELDVARRACGLSHAALGYRHQGKRIGRDALSRAARRLPGHIGRSVRALAESDVFWDTVASKRAGGCVDVYDLVVPGHRNFVADDVIVHNSGAIEQEADAVLFLFRPSYYDRGNDPALKGWAEIIVAKQRNGPTGSIRVAFQEDCTRFDNLQPGDVGVYDVTATKSWIDLDDDDDDFFDN